MKAGATADDVLAKDMNAKSRSSNSMKERSAQPGDVFHFQLTVIDK